jgi:hypothetical protein
VQFEIEERYERGNHLVEVRTHHLRHHPGRVDANGVVADLHKVDFTDGTRVVHAFMLSLSHSRRRYADFFEGEDLVALLEGHRRAFEYLPGSPARDPGTTARRPWSRAGRARTSSADFMGDVEGLDRCPEDSPRHREGIAVDDSVRLSVSSAASRLIEVRCASNSERRQSSVVLWSCATSVNAPVRAVVAPFVGLKEGAQKILLSDW